jgi:acetoin utilization deacetylase AcuC-like enzyme
MIILHHPDSANYATPGHPERPARVVESQAFLARQLTKAEWRRPEPAADEHLRLAHTAAHLERLREPRPFDADTAYHENIADLARLSAGAALAAMELARAGQMAFSLMRPPGHHARADRAMGFCYLNNIAIAALRARELGVARVAIWDFDAHHGNGTEAIIRGREGILFTSVHQFPGYPGTGAENQDNCLNFPVLPDTPSREHMDTLRRSWDAVLAFRPDLILVSAGFDAYVHDPITTMCLERDDFLTLGRWLHDANRPAAALLEGGYSNDLPQLIAAFLEGWAHG